MHQVLFAQSKFNTLSRDEQSQLFSLKINPKEIMTNEEGRRYYYFHYDFDQERQLRRIEITMNKLKMKAEKINIITNLKTKYTAIYYVIIPKYMCNYIERGAGHNMIMDSAYLSTLFDSAAIF